MAKENLKPFFLHIFESIEWIERDIDGLSKEDFLKSVPMQDAVVRRLEIIGEAVKNLPIEFRDNYPKIPWSKIAGMRDLLIHEYFSVDTDLVWSTAKNDLLSLKEQIKEILANQE